MGRTAVFEKLSNLGTMPTPSRVALEIMRLCRDQSASLGDIAAVVETDPALSSKMLQYANSAMVSPGQSIASIPKATVKLGLQTVMNLGLGFSLLAKNREGNCRNFDYQTFWSRSLARAVAARFIAGHKGNLDPDEMFVCGLLLHIGALALASIFPEEYGRLLGENLNREELQAREQEHFGLDNRQISSELFLEWGLPEQYIEAALDYGHDSDPPLTGPPTQTGPAPGRLLGLADTIAEICMLDMPLGSRITHAENQSELLGISEADFEEVFDAIVEQWQKWGHIFSIPTPNCPFYQQVKEIEQADFGTAPEEPPIRILIVDDDPMTRFTLEHLLQGTGRAVDSAEDGEQALALALEKCPDLVITDWKMPRLSGLELCRILRNTSITQHIYIIMLTGRESEEEMVQALDAGADEFVVKPFRPRVLQARIASGERIVRFQRTVNRDREVIQKYAAELAVANRKLQAMAMSDSLTGLPNRRCALERLTDSVAESSRHHEPLSCIMIDIDHFKQINDSYGHDIGDRVLREISDIFQKTVRSYDLVSRIGGEEFLIICARSTLSESLHLAERLRTAVEVMSPEGIEKAARITISLGVSSWNESFSGPEDLIRAADGALYQAKRHGRNQVRAAPFDQDGSE